MIYARKVLEKNGCIIYLAADIKCLDYHTPCSLILEAAGGQCMISCGDVLLFRNKLRSYLQNIGSIRNSSEPVFCSEETSTYIRREGAAIYLTRREQEIPLFYKEGTEKHTIFILIFKEEKLHQSFYNSGGFFC